MNQLHALIDFSAQDDLPPIRLAFGAPARELRACHPSELPGLLDEVDALAARGFWCVGYLRYEAAAAFEPRAAVHPAEGPLAYFSVHRETMEPPALSAEVTDAFHWRQPLERSAFEAGIAAIHRAIETGEVYQVNYTSTLEAQYGGDPFALFCSLRRAQPGCNAAYLVNREETVLSVSPELFFDRDGDRLQCRPMKGTAARGETAELDARRAADLRSSPKERAENVMIVDLLRNDMGRVSQLGSVRVTRLFECQPLPTVWQMTSSVAARTRPGTGLKDLFAALFPCGSVTGAPKLRAMHWIKQLEPAARGIYCGAIGVVQPGGRARFNVPIRTVVLRGDQARCGVGSGITASATAEGEWAEWTHKTQFLEQASRPFRLLQTMRRVQGRWEHLELHLDRLAAASAHFGFPFQRELVRGQLEAADRDAGSCRARVMIDVHGELVIEHSALPMHADEPLPVRLATEPIQAPPAFLRHKTTHRAHYARFEAGTESCFDTLLWNARGEVTEFTRASVVVERADGQCVTPPLHCGLLDGVGRARELATGRASEAVIRVEELASARRIWFVNALRGVLAVTLRTE